MRLVRNSAIALLALAGAVVLAASGIEVLSVDPQPDGGSLVTVRTNDAPPGSVVQAVMVVGGLDLIVDMHPALPNGIEVLRFLIDQPGNRVDLRGIGGELLASSGGVLEPD
jgi:hypothetical protein